MKRKPYTTVTKTIGAASAYRLIGYNMPCPKCGEEFNVVSLDYTVSMHYCEVVGRWIFNSARCLSVDKPPSNTKPRRHRGPDRDGT